MAEATERSQKARKGNMNCCVVNCFNSFRNTGPGVHFYAFATAKHMLEKRDRWIRAVNRKNPDGSLWQPKSHSRICSDHFVGNERSENPFSPSYCPTIFPDIYQKPIVNAKAAVDRRKHRKGTKFIMKEAIVIKEELVMNEEVINEEVIKEEVIKEELENEEVMREEVGLEELDLIRKEKYLVANSVKKNCGKEIIDGRKNHEDMKNICVESSKCVCELMCGQGLISKKERLDISRHFSNLPNRSQKLKFIFQNIVWTVPRKRNTTQLFTKRTSNYIRLYCLPIGGKLTRVCQKTFIAILEINAPWVSESIKTFGYPSKKQLDNEENDDYSTKNFEKIFLVDPDPLSIP